MASFHLNDDDSNISINAKQKSAVADGIIWGTLTIMKRTIERESPKQRAAHDSKPFRQSKMAMTNNTISINVLTSDQKLPARPRDFRSKLADKEMNIGNPELSDVLDSLCRRLILKRSKKNSSSPRGRPISQSDPSNETRGRKSFYDVSRVKQILDQVLNDHESFEKIDNAITSSDIYLQHRKYSIETSLHQRKTYEREFRNTYRPIFKKYFLETQLGNTHIDKEDTANDLTMKTVAPLARDPKSIKEVRRAIYTQGGVVYFDNIMQKHS